MPPPHEPKAAIKSTSRLRGGYAATIMGQQDALGSPEAAAILRASTEAVSAFHRVYQEASTRAIAGQIEGAVGSQ